MFQQPHYLYSYDRRTCNIRDCEAAERERFPAKKIFYKCFYFASLLKYLSVPPQSIAQKWLRENHSIHIAVDFNQYGRWYYRLYDIEDYDFLSETEVDKIYKSYEEALEAGIEEALKHI